MDHTGLGTRAVIMYYLGLRLGRERTRALIVRVPLLKGSDFDRTEAWFARHGTKAVFLGRMVPLFRSLISVPAGIERMRFPVFLALTALGSLLWNSVFVVAGFGLGENWHLVQNYADVFQKIVIGLAVLAVALFVAARLRGKGPGDEPRDTEQAQVITRSGSGR